MLDTLKPDQQIQCTVVKVPRREAQRKTIARLMRQDAAIKRGLRHAHEHRLRHKEMRVWGGRDWWVRPKAARIARVEEGATWTCRFFPQLADDMKSVADFIEVKPA